MSDPLWVRPWSASPFTVKRQGIGGRAAPMPRCSIAAPLRTPQLSLFGRIQHCLPSSRSSPLAPALRPSRISFLRSSVTTLLSE